MEYSCIGFFGVTRKAGDLLANMVDDLPKRRLDHRCELIAVSKRFAGNGDNQSSGAGLENGLSVSEQARWCKMVGERIAMSRVELEPFALPTSRLPLVGGVDEDDEIGSANRLSQFGCQLIDRKNLDRFILHRFSETVGSVPADTIVGPESIAVSDDQNAPHISSF